MEYILLLFWKANVTKLGPGHLLRPAAIIRMNKAAAAAAAAAALISSSGPISDLSLDLHCPCVSSLAPESQKH